ncbi:hypothetical protein ACVWXN_006145 [Bradyrhizobium sp. i1.4.4]
MQRPDVEHDDASDQERQQIVQREEAVQRRVADRIAAPQQRHDALADIGNGGEQIGDDGGAPEAHLAPRQHVAHEARRHHQEVDDDAEDPQHLARLLIGAVIEAAQHVDVDREEEHRRAAGMHVAQQPAVIDVTDDQFDRLEGEIGVRRVMHRQDHAGQDLHPQHEGEDGAEGPPVVQVARGGIDDEGGMDETDDRQTSLDPLQGRIARLVVGWSAHDAILRKYNDETARSFGRRPEAQPIWILVSETNWYGGTGRFAGAGPWRMRPDESYCEPWQGQKNPS